MGVLRSYHFQAVLEGLRKASGRGGERWEAVSVHQNCPLQLRLDPEGAKGMWASTASAIGPFCPGRHPSPLGTWTFTFQSLWPSVSTRLASSAQPCLTVPITLLHASLSSGPSSHWVLRAEGTGQWALQAATCSILHPHISLEHAGFIIPSTLWSRSGLSQKLDGLQSCFC